jgi:hypothetical protein
MLEQIQDEDKEVRAARIRLGIRYGREIDRCVRFYVMASVDAGCRLEALPIVADQLSRIPTEDRGRLTEYVGQIVAALNDANHIAFGVPRKLFEQYSSLDWPPQPGQSDAS